jgi:hypothetical protein
MKFWHKLRQLGSKLFKSRPLTLEDHRKDLQSRLDRMERNYIILLKRVLELDGVQTASKTSAFTTKVMQTPKEELNKGFNEPEPTIH